MIKLSEKAKIILAVLAVAAVAAGAVAFAALSTNADNVQDSLYAGGDPSPVADGDLAYYIETYRGDEQIFWSTTADNAPNVGVLNNETQTSINVDKYTATYGAIQVKVYLSSNGESFPDEPSTTASIPWTNVIESTYFEKSGLYRVDVELLESAGGAVVSSTSFYAKVSGGVSGKTELAVGLTFSDGQTTSVYTGSALTLTITLADSSGTPVTGRYGDMINVEASYVDYYGHTSTEGIKVELLGTGKTIDVVNAGKYTVTITLKDSVVESYTFADESQTAELTFEVTQAIVAGSTTATDCEYSSDMTTETLLNNIKFNGANTYNPGIQYALYSDADFSTPLTVIESESTVYYKAVKVIAYQAGDTTYRNYRLPDPLTDDFKGSIKITKPSRLPAPSASTDYYTAGQFKELFSGDNAVTLSRESSPISITAMYLAFDYSMSQWFVRSGVDYWQEPIDKLGYDHGKYWKVTVNGNVVDPDTYVMRNAGTYNIVITPGSDSGYDKFDNGATKIECTFTIKPYLFVRGYFKWLDRADRVYTGEPIPFGEGDYAIDLPEILNDDNTKLVPVMEWVNKGSYTGDAPVAAGKYDYNVTGFTGDASANYQLPVGGFISNRDTNDPAQDHPYVIRRQRLSADTVATLVNKAFNGTLQSVAIDDELVRRGLGEWNEQHIIIPFFNPDNIVITRVLNGQTYTGDDVGAKLAIDQTNRYCFEFKYAGAYTLSIIATNRLNSYCWPDGRDNAPITGSFDSEPYTWGNFAVVSQADAIDLSSLPSQISTKDTETDFKALVKALFNGLGTDGAPVYTLKFGKSGSTELFDTPQDKENGSYVVGDYFLVISIKDEFHPSCYFAEPSADGRYTLSADKKQATFNYSVSDGVVNVSCNVVYSYTFGDSIDGTVTRDNAIVINKNVKPDNVEWTGDTIEILDESGNAVAESLLVNGLPRNAGKYTVSVTVGYTLDGAAATPWHRDYTLTVNKRTVSLAWTVTNDGATVTSYVFNNKPYVVSAANATTAIAGVTLPTVTLDVSSATDAGEHTFTATGLQGDEADNFTLEGAANKAFTFTIQRAQVTVTAGVVSDITFGEGGLDANTLKYTVTSGAFYGGEATNLTVAVYDKNGALVSADKYCTLAIGAYTVVPVWGTAPDSIPALTSGRYTETYGNYDVTFATSSFNVIAQTLTITFKTGQSGSYGQAVTLTDLIASVTAGSKPMSVADLQGIVEIVAKKGTSEVDLSTANVGEYTLSAKAVGGDYKVVVSNPSATYTVTPLEVTVTAKEVLNHSYGGGRKTEYDEKEFVGIDSLPGQLGVYPIRIDSDNYWLDTMIDIGKAGVGTYYHVFIPQNYVIPDAKVLKDDNGYYFVADVGNYRITSRISRFVIKARALTLNFGNGTSVYGETINLWKQQQFTSNQDREKYSTYIYCQEITDHTVDKYNGLIYWGKGDAANRNLKDVITLSLVDEAGNPATMNGAYYNAGSYRFKAEIKDSHYVIKGADGSEVTEITGGSFVVNPKPISINTTASGGITYGDTLSDVTLSFALASGSALVKGDTVEGLNVTLGVFDSANNNVTDGISAQNAASNYYVGMVSCGNGNYSVTVASKAAFAIAKRNATVTAASITDYVYGSTAPELTYAGQGFVNDEHLRGLNITAQVRSGSTPVTDVTRLAAGGSYTIVLTQGTANGNYNVTLNNGSFTVNKRPVTLTAQDVLNHVYGSGWTGGNKNNELKWTATVGTIVNDDDLNVTLDVYNGETLVTDVSALAKGEYTIKLTASNGNYNITPVNAKFCVVQLEATIKYVSGVSSVYGDGLKLAEAYTVTGLLDSDKNSVIVKLYDSDGHEVSQDGVIGKGDYTVGVTVGDNYKVTFVNADANNRGAYTVTQRQVTVTANDVSHTYGNTFDTSALTCSYSLTTGSGSALIGGDALDVKLEVLNGSSAVTSFNTLPVKEGGYVIKPSQGATANDNYNLTFANGTFTVNKREITITFVEAIKVPGDASARHSTYDEKTPDEVQEILYGSKVITLRTNDLVNSATIKQVLSLTATNASGVSVMQVRAPAGNYTITPTVIDGNYALSSDSATTGTYVIGTKGLDLVSFLTAGTFPYTGAPQKLGDAAYTASDGSKVTVQYVLVANSTASLTQNQVDWSKATTVMPTVTDVSDNMVYMRATAVNYSTAFLGASLNVTPVTLTVTANAVTLTYHDELPNGLINGGKLPASAYTVKQTADQPQGVDEYEGLVESVLNTYLDKLICKTEYTRNTPANATGIAIAPEYTGDKTDKNVTVVCKSGAVTINKATITNVTVKSGYNGVYTGSAYNLFKEMTATTVDGVAVQWQYRVAGATEWTVYGDQSGTNVSDSHTYEVRAVDPNGNHNDTEVQTVDFEITKNAITVKADDTTVIYGNALSTVTLNAALQGTTDLISGEQTRYVKAVTDSLAVNGYTTTSSAGSTFDVSSDYDGDDNVTVTVVKGTLTVEKRPITIKYINGESHTYGDAATAVAELYSITDGSLVDNGHLTVKVVNGDNVEMASTSPAGTYAVKVTLTSDYAVTYVDDTDKEGSYEVLKRRVTVSLQETYKDFTPSADNPLVGNEFDATVVFSGYVAGESVAHNVTYAIKDGAAVTKPVNAGEYVVTVTITDGNYEFDDSTNVATRSFEVHKKVIDVSTIAWKDHTIEYVNGVANENVLEGFDVRLMNVVLFTKTLASDIDNPVPLLERGTEGCDTNNYYYFENNALHSYTLGRARYEVTIELNGEAAKNYELRSQDEGNALTQFSTAFHIASLNVDLTVDVVGWQYSDTPDYSDNGGKTNFTIRVNGSRPLYGLTYMVAQFVGDDAKWNEFVTLSNIAYDDIKAYMQHAVDVDFSADGLAHTLEAFAAYGVGRYVFYVSYDGVVTDGGNSDFVHLSECDVFEVTRKTISSPTVTNVTFNGQSRTPKITLTGEVNGVNVNGWIQTSVDEQTDAATNYTVTFTLTGDGALNYEWDNHTDVLTLNWSILRDDASNDGHAYFTIGSVTNVDYGKQVALPDLTAKQGYDGTFAWSYAAKGNTTSASQITDWTNGAPTQAGNYWLRATLNPTNANNFTAKYDYASVTIEKVKLTLTPGGSLIYGTAFSDGACSYVLNGFIVGENEDNVQPESGTVTYFVKDKTEQEVKKLPVDSYVLLATSTLEYANYYVEAQEGELTVSKLAITVEIGNASGQYGLAHSVTDVAVTYEGSLDRDEVVNGAKAALKTEAEQYSAVNTYRIYSTYTNGNLDITWEEGVYTVTAREVRVTLDKSSAGGTYGGAIGEVTFAVVNDHNGIAELIARDSYTIGVVYGGSRNDGQSVSGSAVPTYAGSYTATVAGNGDANFTLVDVPTVSFVVSKYVVSSALITAEKQMYSGSALTPKLTDTNVYPESKQIWTSANPSDLVNAGDKVITLTLSDKYNYAWNSADNTSETATVIFTIAGAGIYAKPHGSITYGESANGQLKVDFVYASGDHAGETADCVTGNARFIFVDKDGNALDNLDLTQLAAGTYYLTLETDNGFVVGVSSSSTNYPYIGLELGSDNKVILGQLVVNARSITIKPVASSSVYSQNITVSQQFEITQGSLATFDEGKDNVLNYLAATAATNASNVGQYPVTFTAQNNNYVISADGETVYHTVNPIEFNVELSAANGIYNTANAAASVSVSKLTSTNIVGHVFPDGFAVNALRIAVSGTQNNGENYDNANGVMPTYAGNYNATVAECVNPNYKLGNVTGANFVIAKKVINSGVITVDGKVYNGLAQSHGLQDGEGYTVSNDTYRNAARHNVTLTLSDEHNYAWDNVDNVNKTVTVVFEITKRTLTLTPEGTITYGESLASSQGKLGYVLDGLVGDDVGKQYSEIVSGGVTYALADGSDGTKLNANAYGYDIVANVSDLVSDNYSINAVVGKLIVNKRAITVKPDESESVYGHEVIVKQTFTVVGALADGDDNSVISYQASTSATSASNVGRYDLTVSAVNSNYEISIEPGKHTIVPAKVGVSVSALNRTYGESGDLIAFESVVVVDEDKTTEIHGLRFEIRYYGSANDGSYYDSTSAPTKAGKYRAEVTKVLGNNNYVLDRAYEISSAYVTIFRRTVDASQIKAEDAAYTGSPILPRLVDNVYNVDGNKIYNATFEGSLVNVNTYDLTLSLVDVNNYEWVGNLNKNTIIKFNIVKAENRLVDEDNPDAPAGSIKVTINDWTFDGTPNKPQASAADGEVTFEYSTSEHGTYTTEIPQNAGEYWVRATVAASSNYNAFVSEPTKFVIGKKAVTLPRATNLDGNSVYTGSMLSLTIEGFDDSVMSLVLADGMYRADVNGKLNLLALNADDYKASFKLRNNDNYVWADSSQLVDGAVVINWTVERQVISKLPNATDKIVVNGGDITFIPDGFNSGIMTIEGNVRAHAGIYSAVVTLKDTANYVWEGTEGSSITVDFELTGTNTAFIAVICVVAGLCVGLAAMAVIFILVNRRKKRKEAEAIDARSRADGWEDK